MMMAKLYRAKDKYTGLKHCSTQKPLPGDYFLSGTVKTTSPHDVSTSLYTISRDYLSTQMHPLNPGDILVVNGFAYMYLKSRWISVSFNEKEALV
jgi:2-keto-4-pentenoate hydratase/2-oxohepta-3-ene-1,7-dioic acid hydratase in catechol pathway